MQITTRLFADGIDRTVLELTHQEAFDSGIVILEYQPRALESVVSARRKETQRMQIRAHEHECRRVCDHAGRVAGADRRPAFVPGESHRIPEFLEDCEAALMGRPRELHRRP